MAMLNIQVSQQAEAFAEAEALRLGFPDAGAFVSALLEEAAGANGAKASKPGDFFAPKTVDQISAEQGIHPVSDMSSLYGDFWPAEESLDDFLAAVREWRSAGKVGQHS